MSFFALNVMMPLSTVPVPHSPSPEKIRIMIVDDHPMICEGIAAMIANDAGMEVVAQATDGFDAVEKFRSYEPDITLMDLQMPRMNGIEAIAAIKKQFPVARLIVLTVYRGDVNASRAMAAGAAGYLLKNMLRKDLLNSIRKVHAGQILVQPEVRAELAKHEALDEISPREVEVLDLVAQGHTNRAVASLIGVKQETVKSHMRTIMAKLGVNDRTHAVTVAMRRGILGL